MVVIESNQNIEIVDMGVKCEMPVTVPPEEIWAAMIQKVYQPEKFLPVTNVKITDVIPGRHAQREMVLMGHTIREEIYLHESCYKIRGVALDEDSVHINEYSPDTGILEYYQENGKGERTSWKVPKAFALMAMEKTKDLAQEEMQKLHKLAY